MAPMTDMERRRLQLYAKSARLQLLRRQIDALEFVLGPLYREVDELEQRALSRPTRLPTPKPATSLRRAR